MESHRATKFFHLPTFSRLCSVSGTEEVDQEELFRLTILCYAGEVPRNPAACVKKCDAGMGTDNLFLLT